MVFGKVVDGLLTLRKIENVATGPNNRPKLAVKITGMYCLSPRVLNLSLTKWYRWFQNAVRCELSESPYNVILAASRLCTDYM